MNALQGEIASRVAFAYDAIGRIAYLRAQARAKEISDLSGGRVTLLPDQVEALAGDLKAELITDAGKAVRHSLSHYVLVNEPLNLKA